jgi:hypothetical protein
MFDTATVTSSDGEALPMGLARRFGRFTRAAT